MDKKIKKYIIVLVPVLLVAILSAYFILFYNEQNDYLEYDYSRGKTPGTSYIAFTEDYLIYKEDVIYDGMYENKGLYIKQLGSDYETKDDILLSDNFSRNVNVYQNSVYFIDYDYNIQKVNLDGTEKECIVPYDNKTTTDILIIEDTMYYLKGNQEDSTSLYAMNLSDYEITEIQKGVSFRYLYDYCGSACVLSDHSDEIYICNLQNGVEQTFHKKDGEIQGILANGNMIYYKDGKIFIADDFDLTGERVLVELENVYRIIVHAKDMMIDTLEPSGRMQIYEYDFGKEKLRKIGDGNHPSRDYNDEYIVCFSDSGEGNVELMNRKSGTIEVFSLK